MKGVRFAMHLVTFKEPLAVFGNKFMANFILRPVNVTNFHGCYYHHAVVRVFQGHVKFYQNVYVRLDLDYYRRKLWS